MIKGCQKKMIVLRGVESRYFTEAFFVLRDDCPDAVPRADMVSEANRIISESASGARSAHQRKKKLSPRAAAFFYFSAGAAIPTSLSLLFFFIFR